MKGGYAIAPQAGERGPWLPRRGAGGIKCSSPLLKSLQTSEKPQGWAETRGGPEEQAKPQPTSVASRSVLCPTPRMGDSPSAPCSHYPRMVFPKEGGL